MNDTPSKPFAPCRESLIERMDARERKAATAAEIAKDRMLAVLTRMGVATDCLNKLNNGSARAILELALEDLQAAIDALP